MEMRYIVDISPETVDVILREVEKGGYRSIQEFIINAVQNQIYLIDNPIDVYSSTEFSEKVFDTSQEINPPKNHLALEKSEFSTVKPNPELLQPNLSGFWNKFLPSKITVRVLSSLLSENNLVPLALLQEQASLEARSIGLKLVRTEKKSGRKRGDRLFTGLPVKKNIEKTKSRFKTHFVGRLKKKNKIDGLTGTLRLLHIYRAEDGKDYVQLTNFGKEFSDIENPILDQKDYTDSLSREEREYLVQLIKKQLPQEFEEVLFIIKLVMQGNVTTKDLIQEISIRKTELSENQITTHLSGILNRLVDIQLLKRRYDGLSFIYEVSKKGKSVGEDGD